MRVAESLPDGGAPGRQVEPSDHTLFVSNIDKEGAAPEWHARLARMQEGTPVLTNPAASGETA